MALATDLWMPTLKGRLPGAVDAFLLSELQNTIKDFCKDSTAWRGVVRGLDIVAGQRTVATNPVIPSERHVIGILRVYRTDIGLPMADKSHFPLIDGTIIGWTASGDDPSVIELGITPTANEVDALNAWVYYEPTDLATMTDVQMPVVLKRKFYEVIQDGVLGRMYAQPNKPYSNGQSAQYHLKRYRLKLHETRTQAALGFTPGAQNWAFPRFGR